MNELLAEYAGVQMHKVENITPTLVTCICGKSAFMNPCDPINFTTPDGYNLLHKAITEKGDWRMFYSWYMRTYRNNGRSKADHGNAFHELPVEQKAPIIARWLQWRSDGKD